MKLDQELHALSQKYRTLGTGVQRSQTEATADEEYAALVEATATGFRALPMPAGDEATLEGIYRNIDQLAVYVRQYAAATRAVDSPAKDASERQVTTTGSSLNTAFKAFGMDSCTQWPSPTQAASGG